MKKEFFVIGNVSTYLLTHWDIVNKAAANGRGVYIFCFDDFKGDRAGRSFYVTFHRLSKFRIKSDNYDQAIFNQSLKRSIEVYDTSYQYCAMFDIGDNIIGGSFIPYKNPEELKQALYEAIRTYQNS